MSEEKVEITDLPSNLIATIFQFLPGFDMVEAAKTCHKFNDALHKDFLMEELAKRDMMFLPLDESRGKTWKEIVDFLNTYKVREKSGKPSKFKMTPYRGHKSPIEALCTFENRNDFNSTIVSGDSEGNVFTWNEGVDEDDEDEIEMKNDLILKADGKIVGIKKFNDENNMIVWTIKNKFYIYDVNMYQNEKFDKNSKRFELKSEFSIDKDDKIGQVYYNKNTNKLFLSSNFRGTYNNTIAYSYNLKTLSLEIYNFGYDNIQSEFIKKDESVHAAENPGGIHHNNQPNINDIDDFFDWLDGQAHHDVLNEVEMDGQSNDIPLKDKSQTNLVVCGNTLIIFINYEPVKKQLISKYSCKKLLSNAFFIDEETKLYKDFHVDLDYINNIIKISDDKVGFIGVDDKKQISIKIYSTENQVLIGESILPSGNSLGKKEFNLLYSSLPEGLELYYLINNRILYKMNLNNFKQIKAVKLNDGIKEVEKVNCIESDNHRIIITSADSYLSIYDITTGDFWYNFLAGSLHVVPKSFVKHPLYNGFHIVNITRNSITCAMGNLIREFKFVFPKQKKK
jgi:hypothetical protein